METGQLWGSGEPPSEFISFKHLPSGGAGGVWGVSALHIQIPRVPEKGSERHGGAYMLPVNGVWQMLAAQQIVVESVNKWMTKLFGPAGNNTILNYPSL